MSSTCRMNTQLAHSAIYGYMSAVRHHIARNHPHPFVVALALGCIRSCKVLSAPKVLLRVYLIYRGDSWFDIWGLRRHWSSRVKDFEVVLLWAACCLVFGFLTGCELLCDLYRLTTRTFTFRSTTSLSRLHLWSDWSWSSRRPIRLCGSGHPSGTHWHRSLPSYILNFTLAYLVRRG